MTKHIQPSKNIPLLFKISTIELNNACKPQNFQNSSKTIKRTLKLDQKIIVEINKANKIGVFIFHKMDDSSLRCESHSDIQVISFS